MQTQTEAIRRDVEPGASLARAGVFVFSLKGKYEHNYRWECTCKLLHNMRRETAKSVVEVYLKQQFDATGIYFFKRRPDDEMTFHASFIRGDV